MYMVHRRTCRQTPNNIKIENVKIIQAWWYTPTAFNPSTREQSQVDLWEFQADLIYLRATWKTLSENKQKRTNRLDKVVQAGDCLFSGLRPVRAIWEINN